MDGLTSWQSTPFIFEPNSLYLSFIMQGGRPHSGVLAYTDADLPGPQRPRHHPVVSLGLDLHQRIETILGYHEWLPNSHFVSSKVFLEEEDKRMADALCDLDREWKRKRSIWTQRPDTEPPEFRRLAGQYTPTLILIMRAYYLRQALYGAPKPHKRDHELELYVRDTCQIANRGVRWKPTDSQSLPPAVRSRLLSRNRFRRVAEFGTAAVRPSHPHGSS
ncbi:hypothetical protein BJ322DRAFT_1068962 [Thelephora terrestris]|uniref:Uncharacterized protein n=1 Tax=Thelephora terrestris TaxID=56493 RepID=A0A9P6L5J5_9AGAM|nr:hypothetical protein BJ322DRAFT_1068962 [Thelephora terrestris]